MSYDDPNREAVGLAPIWTGAGGETPPAKTSAKTPPEPPAEEPASSGG